MNIDFPEVDPDAFGEQVNGDFFDPLDSISPAKKNMVMFFLIDTSESMRGSRIDVLNQAMRYVLPELVGVGGSNTDVRIAVLAFSSGTEWITPEPVILEEFQYWNDLYAGGVTDLGEALLELNEKMSRKSFLRSPSVSYAPVVFLITDGFPTDNYKRGLEIIQANKWFRAGIRIALALGEGVDMDVLREFTGNPELVIRAHDLHQMKYMIQEIAVTSSQIGSSSMPLAWTEGQEAYADGFYRGPTKEQRMADVLTDMREDMLNDLDLEKEIDYEEGW